LLEANVPDYDLNDEGVAEVPLGDGELLIQLGGPSGATIGWRDRGGVVGRLPVGIESFEKELTAAESLAADIGGAAIAERLRIESLFGPPAQLTATRLLPAVRRPSPLRVVRPPAHTRVPRLPDGWNCEHSFPPDPFRSDPSLGGGPHVFQESCQSMVRP
jgi:hypothetical protein